METITCTKCGVEKPLAGFRLRTKDGRTYRQHRCRACEATQAKARYASDPEKYKSKARQKTAEQPEKGRAACKRWYAKNPGYNREKYWRKPEHYRQYVRQSYSKLSAEERYQLYLQFKSRHPDYSKRWRERNRHIYNEIAARRRARKKQTIVEKIDRRLIIERDDSTCYMCHQKLAEQEITIDHVTALINGGTHTYDNLRVCCKRCNSRKNKKSLTSLPWVDLNAITLFRM